MSAMNSEMSTTTSSPSTSSDYYFDSYSHYSIHEEMLKDSVRTKTYRDAILKNPHLFKDKIVLDVGCGTGILSLFAAKAGAKHVYGLEKSGIIELAREIVQDNGYADRITLIQGKAEEVTLPVGQVDILISEWMGDFLLYESMLETVLFCRDKWLKPNGMLMPDKAVLYITAIEDNEYPDKITYWDCVYGFDLSAIKKIAKSEPLVDTVAAQAVCSTSSKILSLDLLTCTKDDCNFKSRFSIKCSRDAYLHGLCAYFEVAFTQIHKPLGFSTAPFAKYTHWKQTVFYFDNLEIIVVDGDEIDGEICCVKNNTNNRDLDISLTINCNGEHTHVNNFKQEYTLC